MVSDGDAFVNDLRSLVDEALRSVATYDEDGYDFRYYRDELDERAENLAADVHQNLILEGIGKDHLEDLFQAGDLHCTLHEFEEMQAYHFVTGQFEGVFVGLDSDTDVRPAEMRAVVSNHIENR
jgi:hypothetical protein